jgi:hypothetical protein
MNRTKESFSREVGNPFTAALSSSGVTSLDPEKAVKPGMTLLPENPPGKAGAQSEVTVAKLARSIPT